MLISSSIVEGYSKKCFYILSIALSITILSSLTYMYYKDHKKRKIPTKWRRIGLLEKIYLFPIKSCAPLQLSQNSEIICDELGLRLEYFRDRGLMIIDEHNKMLTARVKPKMLLIKVQKKSTNTLMITALNMPPLEINFKNLENKALTLSGNDIHTSVWDTELDAMLCGDKYDKWFSKFLLDKDFGLRLVYYAHSGPVRMVKKRMQKEMFITNNDTGAFADSTSYMLMNLASIDDLNKHLSEQNVNPLQFRGNFYLKMDNDKPYAENNWSWLKIGDSAVFRNVAPCTRCILPNINLDNAERNPNYEPLKTLNKYRKWPNYESPVLGIHLGLRKSGYVKCNDIVYIEDI